METCSLQVLICTINERILNIENIIRIMDDRVSYIISHQMDLPTNSPEIEQFVASLLKRKDITYSRLTGRGVAVNRNNALQYISGGTICLILDDDIIIYDNAYLTVLNSFKKHPHADVISFKLNTPDGNDFKDYPKNSRDHSLLSLTRIGTTEIAFRSDAVVNRHAKFDEHFGPGHSDYPIGEDYIFVMDLYFDHAKIRFENISIAKHPIESTGTSLDEQVIFGRGAVFLRVFGLIGFILDLLFAIKKYKTYRHSYSCLKYLILMWRGSADYYKKYR